MPKISKRSRHIIKDKQIRREEILAASKEIFEQKGFLSATIQDIMRVVGMTRAAFYYHFPTKEAVLGLVIERQMGFLKSLLGRLTNNESLTPEQKIAEAFRWLDLIRKARIKLDKTEEGAPREDPILYHAVTSAAIPSLTEELAMLIERGASEGSFRVRDPKSAALCIVTMAFELLHRAALTDSLVPWEELRLGMWESAARTLGMSNDQIAATCPFEPSNEKSNAPAG